MQENDTIKKKLDKELVSLTLKNQDFFVYIMERYQEKLFYYIRKISNLDKEDIEDLLQEIFIKAYQNLNAFDPNMKFSSWIYRIAHNQTIDHFRKTKSRPQIAFLEQDIKEEILNNVKSDFDIKKEIEKKETKREVLDILNNLDDKYKEVLMLKFIEEKDYKEISDILKKPIGTVSTLINRAKKQFKKEFNINKI